MKKYKIFLIILGLTAQNLFAQMIGSVGTGDVRSISMGNTYSTSAFGVHALGINPANLFEETGASIELVFPFPLPSVSFQAGTNFLSLDEYNYFFGTKTTDPVTGKETGRYLTDDDKTRLKNLFADGGTVSEDLQFHLFALLIKPTKSIAISLSASEIISSSVTFPKGIIDLGIDGNLPNTVYNFNDTKFSSWWIRKYSLSFANNLDLFPKLKSFTIGFSINLYHGFAYSGLDHVNTELTTGSGNVITGNGDFTAYSAFSPDLNVKYNFDNAGSKQDPNVSLFPTPAGKGIGMDFGINTRINDVLSFGLAVTDIGQIKWNKNAAQYSSNKAIYLDDLSNQDQVDSLAKALTGKDSGKYIDQFITRLATALHFGASIQIDKMFKAEFPGKLLWAFDYNQGFNDMPGNTVKPRFSTGGDWDLGTFSFRTGFSIGGIDKFRWGLGFGVNLGIYEMNFGTSNFNSLVSPNSAKRFSLGFDSVWRF